MFKIPAWEDDVPKTASTFIQKIKKKEKPEINRKSSKDNRVKEKNNNVPVNGLNHASQKRKFENNIIKSKKDTISNIKKKNVEETEAIPETQNFDEILLNAKKKKFNEIFENDDKEELLFSESKQVKENQIKTKISPNNLSKNNKSTKDATKLNNKKKKTIVNEEINKNKKNVEVHEENEKTNTEVIAPVSNKKARLLSLLESSSHRNPINVNQTGNKLRNRMLERLKAAQFRYLNEKLYTSSGSDAQQLFQTDPTAFETYHQGYQLQVKKWPVNPLDVIVKKIMKMPKTHTIADLGCGEAALSRRVPHKVRSFDLVATAPGVEACDMARTPLLTASMDVTVYCLALMGTDLTQYLVEANRVLKMGGHLLIAEVESRFDKVDNFVKDVERLGFKLKQLDNSNNVFFFIEFTKIRDPPVKKAKLPVLTLKPCLYKRR